jgi:hypothetical protein
MGCILVAYRLTEKKCAQWARFLKGIPAETSVVVVENDSHFPVPAGFPAAWTYIRGSNTHFEFSGYREGLEALRADADRVLIVNDSLFTHHAWNFWRTLIHKTKNQPGISGDPRDEPIDFDGRPLRIYASWLFLMQGREALETFSAGLDHVLARFDSPIESPEYTSYLDRYLRGTWLRGYTAPHSLREEGALRRKKLCIYAEHRLGRYLEEQVGIHPVANPLYRYVRQLDRFAALRRRVLQRLKSSKS